MRGSVLAYSGSMGNAVRITHNNIYGNTAGISTDTISAGGHPGFPADSVQVDHNYIYSNNLDLFKPNPPVEPAVGILPVGVGIFWAGHNNGARARQLDLGQLAQRRLPALDPGLPRHARGQRQPGRLVQERPDAVHLVRQPLLRQPPRPRAEGLQAVPGAVRSSATTSGATTRRGARTASTSGGTRAASARSSATAGSTTSGADGTAASVTGPGVGRRQRRAALRLRDQHEQRRRASRSPTCCPASWRARATLPPEQCDWYTLPPQARLAAAAAQAAARSRRARASSSKTARAKQLRGPDRRADGDPGLEPP